LPAFWCVQPQSQCLVHGLEVDHYFCFFSVMALLEVSACIHAQAAQHVYGQGLQQDAATLSDADIWQTVKRDRLDASFSMTVVDTQPGPGLLLSVACGSGPAKAGTSKAGTSKAGTSKACGPPRVAMSSDHDGYIRCLNCPGRSAYSCRHAKALAAQLQEWQKAYNLDSAEFELPGYLQGLQLKPNTAACHTGSATAANNGCTGLPEACELHPANINPEAVGGAMKDRAERVFREWRLWQPLLCVADCHTCIRIYTVLFVRCTRLSMY
jgi:hypothetical protein